MISETSKNTGTEKKYPLCEQGMNFKGNIYGVKMPEEQYFADRRQLAGVVRDLFRGIAITAKERQGSMKEADYWDIEDAYNPLSKEALIAYLEDKRNTKEIRELPTALFMLLHGDQRKEVKKALTDAMRDKRPEIEVIEGRMDIKEDEPYTGQQGKRKAA